MSKHQPIIKNFRVADIRVLGKHRPLVKKKVRELADSIKAIGLNTPPTVRLRKKRPVLVTGYHRLAAVKLLSWSYIDCLVIRAALAKITGGIFGRSAERRRSNARSRGICRELCGNRGR